MRTSLFTVFGVISAVACSIFLFLKAPCCTYQSDDTETPVETTEMNEKPDGRSNDKNSKKSIFTMIIESIIDSSKLLITPEMLLLTSLLLYSGFIISFYSGIYPTSVGNSKKLPDSTATVGLVGVCNGAGEVIGGGLFVFGSKIMDKIKRPYLLSG